MLLTSYIPDLYDALDSILRRIKDSGETVRSSGSSCIIGRAFTKQQMDRAMGDCFRGNANILSKSEILDYVELLDPNKKKCVGVSIRAGSMVFEIL